MGTKSNKKSSKNKNENIKEKSYKLSDEVTENIIITLVLILFLVIVCVVVIYVIRVNNPNSFKSDEELYALVLPQGSKQEKSFIRLVATFVTLLKTSCKSLQEVLQHMKFFDDERSFFITKHIFMPVYRRVPTDFRLR